MPDMRRVRDAASGAALSFFDTLLLGASIGLISGLLLGVLGGAVYYCG